MKTAHFVFLILVFFIDLKVKALSLHGPAFTVVQNQVAPITNDLNQALSVPDSSTAAPAEAGAAAASTATPPTATATATASPTAAPSEPIAEVAPPVDSDVQTILEPPGTGRLENVNINRARVLVQTNRGRFSIKFYGSIAPANVENFLALALGKKVYANGEGRRLKQPFYNGLKFFKVVPGFVIQAGCPLNTGIGGPGYSINDEINADTNFDKAGIVGMSNYGPNTNGSQFFITLQPQPFLNKKFTAIGEVDEGMEIIKKIGRTLITGSGRPVDPVVIESIELIN